MKKLRKIDHPVFHEFYIGSYGCRIVHCILDDNCVRFVVLDPDKKTRIREFNNSEKDKCMAEAEKALYK